MKASTLVVYMVGGLLGALCGVFTVRDVMEAKKRVREEEWRAEQDARAAQRHAHNDGYALGVQETLAAVAREKANAETPEPDAPEDARRG